MSSFNPRAEGVRVDWENLPAAVRAGLEHRLGSRVVESITQPTGFSPGLAARIRLENDRRVFIKAVSATANPDTPSMHRREARIVAALPASAPVPRLMWTYDDAGWVALCFEDVQGRHPHEPWTEPDLALVVDALRHMAEVLTPSPFEADETAAEAFADHIKGWALALQRGEARLDDWCAQNLGRLAELEAEAPTLAAGRSLVHFDVRADNLLLAGNRVYVIDWPWARLGPAWVDWVAMAPSVAMQGGPAPETFLRRFDVSGVSDDAITAVVCTLAGFFVERSLAPAPPGLPTLRAFQAAQGRVAIDWLRQRTGWSA